MPYVYEKIDYKNNPCKKDISVYLNKFCCNIVSGNTPFRDNTNFENISSLYNSFFYYKENFCLNKYPNENMREFFPNTSILSTDQDYPISEGYDIFISDKNNIQLNADHLFGGFLRFYNIEKIKLRQSLFLNIGDTPIFTFDLNINNYEKEADFLFTKSLSFHDYIQKELFFKYEENDKINVKIQESIKKDLVYEKDVMSLTIDPNKGSIVFSHLDNEKIIDLEMISILENGKKFGIKIITKFNSDD